MSGEVIIVWLDVEESDLHTGRIVITCMVYDGGKPGETIRCYEKDRYDARMGKGLPYFDDQDSCGAWMVNNPGKPCQLDRDCLPAFGFYKKDVAPLNSDPWMCQSTK